MDRIEDKTMKFRPFQYSFLLLTALMVMLQMGKTESYTSTSPFLSRVATQDHTRQLLRTYNADNFHLTTSLKLSASDSGNNEPPKTKQELTPETVAEMIEVSFVNGVMQLAQGYVDVLKLFVVAVQSGYSLEIPPTELFELVNKCPVQSANRPLMDEEIQLRNTWMQLVYLVLNFVQYQGKTILSDNPNQLMGTTIQETYGKTIPILSRAKEHGLSFDADRIQECSNALPDSVNLNDPMEKAIISQSLRVIWLTFVVLDEEEQCAEDKRPVKPQPPIPGAFD